MDDTSNRPIDLDQYGDNALLTLVEAAGALRAPPNTLRYWRHRGTGPRFFKIGRQLMTTAADLRTWIQEQKRDAGFGVQ